MGPAAARRGPAVDEHRGHVVAAYNPRMFSRRLAPIALALAAATLATGCVSFRPFADVERTLPSGRLIEVQGQKVSIERSGEGAPLVLLHGFGESTLSFSAVLPELSRHFDVIAIDLNGFGFTQRPRESSSYTLAGQERLVLGVLDALHLDRVRLAGHSYGGAISLYIAARHPERVDRLLLIDNALPLYASARRSALFRWRWVASLAARTVALSDMRVKSGLKAAYFDDSLVTPQRVREYGERLRIQGASDALFGLVGPSDEPPYTLDLAALETPTLVVWGIEDTLIPIAGARERSHLLPRARFVELPACGHSPMEECPTPFLAAVLPFLESADAASISDPASNVR
ncbi:MAG: alpha/beta fold hydrolase [Thermoanaerobaculia bacterium]